MSIRCAIYIPADLPQLHHRIEQDHWQPHQANISYIVAYPPWHNSMAMRSKTNFAIALLALMLETSVPVAGQQATAAVQEGMSTVQAKDERTAPQAATIGLACAQLAAHALGLGTSWSGGINTAAQAYPPLIELLGLPEGVMSFGTVLLGYSAETFTSIPTRKPLDVTWLRSEKEIL